MKRRYELKKRAQDADATRQRIVEAAVSLHQEVGPALTTVDAIARLAGVSRPTVYAHFPNARRLFEACTAHYRALNPPPDLEDATLTEALERLYAWYRGNERMFSKGYRDAPLVPALAQALEGRDDMLARMRDGVVRRLPPPRGRRVRAAVGHAVSFRTWQSLTGDQRLTDTEAVTLMVGFVEAARATTRQSGAG